MKRIASIKTDRKHYDALLQVAAILAATAILLMSCSELPTTQNVSEAAVVQVPQTSDDCANPLHDSQAAETLAKNDPNLYAWKLFLYLNCPSDADPSSPRIWETWSQSSSVYLPGGKQPVWGPPQSPRTLSFDSEISGTPITDKNGQPMVFYEVRMNEAAFNYIVERGLYSRQGQIDFFNDPAADPVNFPPDAVEVKAAWIVLDPNDPSQNSRYYTTEAILVEGQPVLVGLGGFHIASKILPDWVWTTFEQVDNQVVTGIKPVQPIPPDVQELNKKFHAGPASDGPWLYYDQRGTQTTFTDASNKPTLLANTLIESDFQESSSCITCHNLSSRGDESNGRLGFFNADANMQAYVGNISDPGNIYRDTYGDQVCFDQQQNIFYACDDSSKKPVYKLMDFVWSFREAKK